MTTPQQGASELTRENVQRILGATASETVVALCEHYLITTAPPVNIAGGGSTQCICPMHNCPVHSQLSAPAVAEPVAETTMYGVTVGHVGQDGIVTLHTVSSTESAINISNQHNCREGDMVICHVADAAPPERTAQPTGENVRDRPSDNPGGMECQNCGAIFIGDESHSLCAVCLALPENQQRFYKTNTAKPSGASEAVACPQGFAIVPIDPITAIAPEHCPHATSSPLRYCDPCPVSPCPMEVTPPVAPAVSEPVAPITLDDSFARYYIPLPGGWEVQTKGCGSSFRISGPDDFRLNIEDRPYMHETLERMARDIHKAVAAPPEPTVRHALWVSFNEGVVWNVGMERSQVETGAEIVRKYVWIDGQQYDGIKDERHTKAAQPTGASEAVALTFDAFRAANVARCVKWHPAGIASWSPSDWLTAVTGELGELASLLKMRNRERDGLPGNKFSPTDKQVADELADVLTYLDLLAAAMGVNLGQAAVSKFNEVSERVGFPDRIHLGNRNG